ncbi:hypothetical protein MHYP_G00280260 [Metynnis hypsauchen]
MQHKHPNDRKSAKNVKKLRAAEVNYLPPYPVGEDEQSLEKEREELISESKKKNNEKVIKEKMSKTFAHRRHEIVNRCIQDFKDRWPALFDPSQDTEGLEVDQLLTAVVVKRNMGDSTDDRPNDIGIVIEGVQVITGLKDTATACAVLFGLTYVLNLS